MDCASPRFGTANGLCIAPIRNREWIVRRPDSEPRMDCAPPRADTAPGLRPILRPIVPAAGAGDNACDPIIYTDQILGFWCEEEALVGAG